MLGFWGCIFWLSVATVFISLLSDYLVDTIQGRAVQVDPIKPALKAPGIQRLKLTYDDPLSNIAFKFNLRRFTKAPPRLGTSQSRSSPSSSFPSSATPRAGAYTRSEFSST